MTLLANCKQLRIKPVLTPLAAGGLVIIVIGATVITLASGAIAAALMPLVVGLLAALSSLWPPLLLHDSPTRVMNKAPF
ncbi:MAG TPA: hypothetical protein VKY19_01985 [Ktedonosporobacter sp.]|nr:hypothetical protein [Ktedonosporobacter sp.]